MEEKPVQNSAQPKSCNELGRIVYWLMAGLLVFGILCWFYNPVY
jgi:hypothetical protein